MNFLAILMPIVEAEMPSYATIFNVYDYVPICADLCLYACIMNVLK